MFDFRLPCKLFFLSICLSGCTAGPEFYDSEGRKVELDNFQGDYLLINYWAEWCKPCLEEIPELNSLAMSHGDKLVVIGASFDELPLAELQAQVQRLGMRYPVLTMNPAVHLKIDTPEVLPTSYLIDANHKVIKVFVGPQTVNSILKIATTK